MNDNLQKAKAVKNDEFYTLLKDIKNELQHYTQHFKGKIIYCNCDNPKYSNFWKYFYDNFEKLELKKLVATYYNPDETVYKTEYDGINESSVALKGNGDFASDECIDILKESDIVVTNPPFSLFRKYVGLLNEYNKRFIIVGNENAIIYRKVFPLIKNNEIWLGYNHIKEFLQPNNVIKKFGNICWFTNLEIDKIYKTIPLTEHYINNEDKYPKYDNYDAINVDKVKDIPCDYDGVMGVPITFLNKYNPKQFDIIGLGTATLGLSIGVQPYKFEHKMYRKNIQKRGTVDGDLYMLDDNGNPVVPYSRILIKRIGE